MKTAIDPICGMTVDPAHAISLEVDGQPFYFCCPGCRDRFAHQPGTDKETGRQGDKELPIVQLSPPHLTSASPPAAPSPGLATYTCPMHPEIEQVGPGTCPICGMDLEPKTVTAGSGADVDNDRMQLRFWIAAALSAPLL